MSVGQLQPTTPIPAVIHHFWSDPPSQKARQLEALLTGSDDQFESRLCGNYRSGQYAEWVRRIIPHLIPPGMSKAYVAYLLGVHPAQLTRGQTDGALPAENLYQLLRIGKFQFKHLPDRLPDPIGMLAGMAKIVLLAKRNCEDTLHDNHPDAHHRVADKQLSLSDTALLFSLVNNGQHLRSWCYLVSLYRGDLSFAIEDPKLHALLGKVLDGAITLTLADETIVSCLAPWKSGKPVNEDFLRHLAHVWNDYQLAWACAMEAVFDLLLVPESLDLDVPATAVN